MAELAEEDMMAKKKEFWGAAVGALDPVLKNWAQGLAKKVPANSFLRSDFFGVAQGVIKGLIESLAEKLPVSTAVAVEKAIDFSDFFSGALGGASEKEKKEVTEDWMKKFFVDAGWRLKKARDLQEEFKRIKMEFELRYELIKLMEATQQKPSSASVEQTQQTSEINWKEEWEKFIKKFHEFSDGLIEFGKEFNKEFQISEGIKKTDQAVAQKLGSFRKILAERGIR